MSQILKNYVRHFFQLTSIYFCATIVCGCFWLFNMFLYGTVEAEFDFFKNSVFSHTSENFCMRISSEFCLYLVHIQQILSQIHKISKPPRKKYRNFQKIEFGFDSSIEEHIKEPETTTNNRGTKTYRLHLKKMSYIVFQNSAIYN